MRSFPFNPAGSNCAPAPASPFWLPLVLALLFLIPALQADATSSFSEPDLTVYGRVLNGALGPNVLASTGEVVWTFTAADSSQTVVTTSVQAIGDSGLNYRLEVPVQIDLAGFAIASDSLPATAADSEYTLSVTVDGEPATLLQGDGSPFAGPLPFAEVRRGTFARIDLNFAGEVNDADFDSIPDFWEQRYAPLTNANNPLDALDDIDGDGVSNLAEFLNGTSPDCYEWSTWLARHTLPESDLSLSAADADPDNDCVCNAMEYALGGDPRTPDAATVLARAQTETATDASTGEQYLTLQIDRPAHRQCAVDYVVETSANLVDWESEEGVDIATLLNDATQVRVRDARYMGEPGVDRRFIRLRLVAQ